MREHELLQCKSGLAVEFCVVLSYYIKMESGFWTNPVVLDDFHSCATADHVDTDKRLPRNTNANCNIQNNSAIRPVLRSLVYGPCL